MVNKVFRSLSRVLLISFLTYSTVMSLVHRSKGVLRVSYNSRKCKLPLISSTTQIRTMSSEQPAVEGLSDSNDVVSTSSYLDQKPTDEETDILYSFLHKKKNVLVISGAGMSTSSGVPDYRGPLGSYKLGHKPMIHSDFMNKEQSRKRYWARSMVGWKDFANARPNFGHYAIAALEMKGIVSSVITQNVDRLHHTAGSQNVIELHGRNDRVVCCECGCNLSRKVVQQQIESINSKFLDRIKSLKLHELSRVEREGIIRADGDTELGISDFSEFVLPECPRCGSGILKPDVVFFGDSVPKERVQQAFLNVDNCDGLLVVGTSLEVYSAYRFVNHAAAANKKQIEGLISNLGANHDNRSDNSDSKNSNNISNDSNNDIGNVSFQYPIAICNIGETRAERMKLPGIMFKSEANCANILKAVVDRL